MTRSRRSCGFLYPALLGLADDAALVEEMASLTDAELDARIDFLKRRIVDAGGDGVWLATVARIEGFQREREKRGLTPDEQAEVRRLLILLRESA